MGYGGCRQNANVKCNMMHGGGRVRGGGSGLGGQSGWEWRIKAFVKIKKKKFFFGGGVGFGGGGGGGQDGVRVDVNGEVKFL